MEYNLKKTYSKTPLEVCHCVDLCFRLVFAVLMVVVDLLVGRVFVCVAKWVFTMVSGGGGGDGGQGCHKIQDMEQYCCNMENHKKPKWMLYHISIEIVLSIVQFLDIIN